MRQIFWIALAGMTISGVATADEQQASKHDKWLKKYMELYKAVCIVPPPQAPLTYIARLYGLSVVQENAFIHLWGATKFSEWIVAAKIQPPTAPKTYCIMNDAAVKAEFLQQQSTH